MAGGRPLKFDNCLDLDAMCHLYFEECEEDKKHPTVSGLAYYLDVDRKTITNYQNRDEFFPTIKRAKAYIESYLEQWLFGNNVTGTIFNLKNNFGWTDRLDIGAEVKTSKETDDELDNRIKSLLEGTNGSD